MKISKTMLKTLKIKTLLVVFTTGFFLVGCSSAQKQRKEQRDQASQTSGLYCDFVNGEIFPDLEVALNLEIAKRCDIDRSLTISSYKTPSENQGVLYCCVLRDVAAAKSNNPAKSADVKATDSKAPHKEDKPASKDKDAAALDAGSANKSASTGGGSSGGSGGGGAGKASASSPSKSAAPSSSNPTQPSSPPADASKTVKPAEVAKPQANDPSGGLLDN